MSHTPGPWEASFDEYGDEIWFGGSGCGTWEHMSQDDLNHYCAFLLLEKGL